MINKIWRHNAFFNKVKDKWIQPGCSDATAAPDLTYHNGCSHLLHYFLQHLLEKLWQIRLKMTIYCQHQSRRQLIRFLNAFFLCSRFWNNYLWSVVCQLPLDNNQYTNRIKPLFVHLMWILSCNPQWFFWPWHLYTSLYTLSLSFYFAWCQLSQSVSSVWFACYTAMWHFAIGTVVMFRGWVPVNGFFLWLFSILSL